MTGLALLSMAVAPRVAWGQWSTGAGGTIYYNGGNVGIGTDPVQILHTKVSSGDSVWRMDTATKAAGILKLFDATGDVALQTNTLPNAIYIKDLGNVGIGTTNPQYKLAVNGNIGAQDIIVTNTGWADYVFQPGYRLRPLSEVSQFIQANGHLPDIPAEAEVKDKGVSMAEMQAKMLAKIEELTLHMIREHERNDRLQAETQALERANRQLQEQLANLEAKQ